MAAGDEGKLSLVFLSFCNETIVSCNIIITWLGMTECSRYKQGDSWNLEPVVFNCFIPRYVKAYESFN